MSRHRARRVFYFRDWRAAIDRKSSRILIGWSSQLEIANSPHLAETGRLQRLNHHRVAQQCQFNFQHLSLCQYAILRYHFVTLALLATWGVQAIVPPVEIPTFKYQMGYSSPTKVCGVTTYVHRAATKPGRYK